MKAAWRKLVARIDALTLRERTLLFTCIVVALGAITEEVFIAPLTKLQAEQAREIDRRSAQMEATRERVEAELRLRRGARIAELEEEIASLRSQLQAADRDLAQVGAATSDVESLRASLTRALRQADRVALVRMGMAEGATAPAPGAPASPTGIEVTLAGSWPDLMDTLARLQAALPHARWSALHVNAEVAPPQATVRIVARATP